LLVHANFAVKSLSGSIPRVETRAPVGIWSIDGSVEVVWKEPFTGFKPISGTEWNKASVAALTERLPVRKGTTGIGEM